MKAEEDTVRLDFPATDFLRVRAVKEIRGLNLIKFYLTITRKNKSFYRSLGLNCAVM